jgi:tetratricopeptide (TPR) repeat protein
MNLKFNCLVNISYSRIAYLAILILALTVYSKSLYCGFVYFDDSIIISNLEAAGPNINPLESFNRDAFLSTQNATFYRPIQGFTYIIDYCIGGIDPTVYHATNILIHILTCMGLFSLLKMLGFDNDLSLLMTLLFTVHPLFNQAVAWIPARGDLLIGLFGILSVIALLKFLKKDNWLFLSAHLTAFFLSVFSKETTILFPMVYALIYFFSRHDKNWPGFINTKTLALLAGWILIIGFYLYMRSTLIKTALKPEQFGIHAFLSNIWVLPEFTAKFFVPIKLSGLPQCSILISSIGVAIITGIAIFSILPRKNFNYLSFIGIAWFLIFTTITMTYRHQDGKAAYDYLEHRTYLPSIGLIIFVMSSVKYSWKKKLIYWGIPLIFLYSAYSYVNMDKFRNPIAFYNSVIDGGTNVAGAYNNRGVSRQKNGDIQGAFEDYLKAISIKNDFAFAYYNKGGIEHETKEYEAAIEDYTKAIKADPDLTVARLKRGAVYYDRGVMRQNNGDMQGAAEDYLTALDDYTKGVKTKPEHAGAYSNRGDIYLKINRREEAMADYNMAIKLNPKYAGAYNNLGILHGTEGNHLESIKYFTKAIEYDNKLGNAYMNRGLAYLFLGDKEKACEDFKLSMECGSDSGKQLYENHCR